MESSTCYTYLIVCVGLWYVLMLSHLNSAGYQVTHISIQQGDLCGKIMKTISGTTFVAFRGIPYAQPPVKELRFKPPQPPKSWSLVRDAQNEGSVCPQLVYMTDYYVGEEDCLYLNVYRRPGSVNLPVVVWIHGGAFYAGNGGQFDSGPEYLMERSIILVTFNYRLGPLGFLSTGDSILPGNYGLKDQVEALKWIQKNIASFGGNPDSVTLLGYSAGGASVSLHLLSPLSRGLFHRAIVQSGSVLNCWSLDESPIEVFNTTATLVGCSNLSSPTAALECLMQMPAERLVKTLYRFPYWGMKYPVPYAAVIELQNVSNGDPPFLTQRPEILLRESSINPVPLIIGTAANEHMHFALKIHQNWQMLAELDVNFVHIMRDMFKLRNFSCSDLSKIRTFYFGSENLDEVTPQQLEHMISDSTLVYGVYRFANLYANVSGDSVYYYLFTFEGRISEVVAAGTYPEPYGVCHTDDLLYVLNRKYLPFPNNTPNAEEWLTIQRMTTFIADFAATGNPTPETTAVISAVWKPLDPDCLFQYMEIGKDLRMVEDVVFPDRMMFWDNLYESFSNDTPID